ncbi:DUF3850 domain-containing protein [Enterococcus sp. AZ192]|uniref:DUF3850 domain-containing protein n=1 Tax=unclassified Enterococcus TaxID=2608891 RepID=UPI003D29FC9D
MGNIDYYIKKNKMKIERNERALENGMSSHAVKDLDLCNEMREEFIEDLRQLRSSLPNQQDKIVVPEFVAEWIEHCRKCSWDLRAAMSFENFGNFDDKRKLKKWFLDGQGKSELFARAWQDGYTVVKEPRKHVLKLDSEYYDDVVSGFKKFEIRFNDRDYKVGDILVLEEYDGIDYTGDRCKRIVTYITDYAQQDGYVVLGIEPVEEEAK